MIWSKCHLIDHPRSRWFPFLLEIRENHAANVHRSTFLHGRCNFYPRLMASLFKIVLDLFFILQKKQKDKLNSTVALRSLTWALRAVIRSFAVFDVDRPLLEYIYPI